MTIPAHFTGSAGTALATERLGQYARYAELVALQEAALDSEDFAAFEELGRQIAALQQDIGAPGADAPPGTSDSATDDETARESARILLGTMERVGRIHSRLAAMRRAGAEEVRTVSRRRPQARRYVADSGSAAVPTSHLDVRL